MARSRNIKPGFYKNEDLAECSVWARLIFPGLWMLADREGRLEDRPKRIKGELLPFDSVEVEPLLVELEARQFLVRYQNSDGRFIQISKFSTHQTPHYSEKASVIKPPELQESSGDDEVEKLGVLQEDSKSTPGNDQPLRGGHNPLIPDSLIPDSLNLIPDSGFPSTPSEADASVVAAEKPAGDLPAGKVVSKANGHRAPIPPCPHEKIVALYHDLCPTLNRVKVWNGQREEYSRSRWRETFERLHFKTEDEGLEWFRSLFTAVSESEFLTGKVPSRNPGQSPWKADLEWLLRPQNFRKVIEEKYWSRT